MSVVREQERDSEWQRLHGTDGVAEIPVQKLRGVAQGSEQGQDARQIAMRVLVGSDLHHYLLDEGWVETYWTKHIDSLDQHQTILTKEVEDDQHHSNHVGD